MRALLPHVKLVLLLREPVSRAKSAHAMGVLNGREKRSVEAALTAELASLEHCLAVTVPTKRWPRLGCLWSKFYPTWDAPRGLKEDSWKGMTGPQGSYLMPGLYVLQLRHWLRAFPMEQFHIMSSRAFQGETKDEMRRLSEFLDRPPRQGRLSATPAKGHGSSTEKVATSVVNEEVLKSRHRTKSSSVKSPQKLSSFTEESLMRFFEPFNIELWSLIGRKIKW